MKTNVRKEKETEKEEEERRTLVTCYLKQTTTTGLQKTVLASKVTNG